MYSKYEYVAKVTFSDRHDRFIQGWGRWDAFPGYTPTTLSLLKREQESEKKNNQRENQIIWQAISKS